MEGDQISIPSLIFILVLGGLIIRYLFFSGPGAGGGGSGGNNAQPRTTRDSSSAMRTREAAVERIQQMFPQIDRRSILWDLQRNGCNIAATTERILSNGRLDPPPITFQPPPPPTSSNAAGSGSGQAQAPKQAPRPTQPDLITRYKLHDRLNESSAGEEESEKKEKAWSANKNERHSLLQKRRDDMILAARRRMEAKIAAEKVGSS